MTGSPEIDKGVPMPSGHALYPWAEMEVGDSFFIDGPKASERLQRASGEWRRKHASGKMCGLRFTVRQEIGGARVWRTA